MMMLKCDFHPTDPHAMSEAESIDVTHAEVKAFAEAYAEMMYEPLPDELKAEARENHRVGLVKARTGAMR